jgi:hypothetical protein
MGTISNIILSLILNQNHKFLNLHEISFFPEWIRNSSKYGKISGTLKVLTDWKHTIELHNDLFYNTNRGT